MDATTSPQVPSDFNDVVCNLIFKTKNSSFSPTLVRKNTIVKYAKLPDYDFDSKVTWPKQDTYILPAKLRKIIALENQVVKTTRTEGLEPGKFITAKRTTRKTVTLTDDESHQITRLQKTSSARYSHKAVGSEDDKTSPLKSSARTTSISGKKLARSSVKSASWNSNKDVVPKNNRGKSIHNSQFSQDTKSRYIHNKEKQSIHNNKSQNGPSKVSVSKSMMPPNANEQEFCHIKSELTETIFRSETSSKKNNYYRPKSSTLTAKPCTINEFVRSNKGSIAIHVPTDTNSNRRLPRNNTRSQGQKVKSQSVECSTETGNNQLITKDVKVQIRPDLSQGTGTQTLELEIMQRDANLLNSEFINLNEIYDCLNTPNIKLTKDRKCTPKESEISVDNEQSLTSLEPRPSNEFPTTEKHNEGEDSVQNSPELTSSPCLSNLESGPLKNNPTKEEHNKGADRPQKKPDLVLKSALSNLGTGPFQSIPANGEHVSPQKSSSPIESEDRLVNSPSFIISRRTLTYTTNFDVVGSSKVTSPFHSTSNLSPSLKYYPLNVMTVFRSDNVDRFNQVPSALSTEKTTKDEAINIKHMNHDSEDKSVECSSPYDSCKLIKPSEIISTIRVNTGLLQNDYICEQFERELNFIDSFFESLQYLENCSLADKCFTDSKVENLVNNSGFNNPEYDSLFSNLENGAPTDTETMASKSLCLLNLLIRDEQRRAKNLLFVLKMREDALKDFTKSQILWLENKKKSENTDISTLKKKQRGALLKLQHECGEMQRMRKALLALSEKRKVALMKTKNNIELKLKNNVTVDHILLGKKKLKRSTTTDRNIAPLKCFDLSSSGCDDVTPPRGKSDTQLYLLERSKIRTNIAEKCVQTGDSLLGSCLVDSATDTAAENFVTVDGTYLNILFQNLPLPQIFSAGKQYEVNEEALRNIVNTNAHMKHSESVVFDSFMDQIKNRDQDSITSSPSTARSLVEELDQYYKGLAEEDKLPLVSLEQNALHLDLNKEKPIVVTDEMGVSLNQKKSQLTAHVGDKVHKNTLSIEMDARDDSDSKLVSEDMELSATSATLTGPLPVPAGAAAAADAAPPNSSKAPCVKISFGSNSSITSQESQSSELVSPVSSLTSPVHIEAEELRRQQLDIEREIKALEQQQCQLLAVREIPDKPPPPYTPPTDVRIPRPSPIFQVDDTIDDKVHKQLCKNIAVTIDPSNVFDIYLQDYCEETISKHKLEQSDMPWDACNLLPQKSPTDMDKLAATTTSEVKGLLSGLAASVVSGVGARRSDHIDEILFTEWKRCETEWTTLHTDEVAVKNQIFEGIFQRVLSETIDEYKKTVSLVNTDDDLS